MWVVDGGGVVGEFVVEDGDFFVDDFVRCVGEIYGDFGVVEGDVVYGDFDELVVVEDDGVYEVVGDFDGEVGIFDEFLVLEVVGENVEVVVGFFGF